MPLEVICELPAHESRSPPLLFVHGAWHGAWCWHHFLPFFAGRGFASYALSFRGHGSSTVERPLRTVSVRDYVADLAEVIARLPARPVLIAHSMGGFVAHHYLRQNDAAAVVFLASVPPRGAWRATWHALRRQPVAFLQANARMRLYPLVSTVERARDLLFSSAMPEAEAAEYQRRLQDESYRAYVEMLLRPVRSRGSRRTPVLVLNAAEDAIIDQADMRSTGAHYRCPTELVPSMGHDMMLEPGWQGVAERILRWLQEQGLAPESPT